MIRYRLDTILRARITQHPKLRNLLNPKSEPRMQLRSMQRRPDPLAKLFKGYGSKYGQLLEDQSGFSR